MGDRMLDTKMKAEAAQRCQQSLTQRLKVLLLWDHKSRAQCLSMVRFGHKRGARQTDRLLINKI